ncbi:MAG: HlyD family efflux transporter periplasmic adaptor subunit [Betaproteobacteria bacterium]|nr:HlyD family efflux transporter periplasmic adaptor subunit [Betaproteobacteria bacterium]MDE2625357.1 HlyD family efflux transporter periplasmic adaptor subunit [Betaproteobacteria bacterium]
MSKKIEPKKNEPMIIDLMPLVQGGPPAPDPVPTNPRGAIWLGWLILLVGFGGFLWWTFSAHLDEGVPVQGVVVSDSKRQTVQHQTGGTVDAILVRDGDTVKKGQVLMRLVNEQNQAAIAINAHLLESLGPQLKSLEPLVQAGYYPRNQYLDLQRQYDDAEAKLKLAQEENRRMDIRAPVSGTVMGETITTVGGVVQPGMRIMEIEPAGDRLVLEAQIPTHLIDKVHAGLQADVRMSALNQRTTPVLNGIVQWVSPDRFQEPQRPEIAYYTARIELAPGTDQLLKGEKLQPGMPAEIIIKTGSRTFWNYLVKPIEDRAALSLKER